MFQRMFKFREVAILNSGSSEKCFFNECEKNTDFEFSGELAF